LRQPRCRPSDGVAAALRAGAEPVFQTGQHLGGRGVGRARAEWRGGTVFEPELDRLRRLAIGQDAGERQREIDSGGNAAEARS